LEIVDITQIEEELAKIREHYAQLNSHSRSMCQLLRSSEAEANEHIQRSEQSASKMDDIFKDLEALSAPNRDAHERLDEYLKKVEGDAIGRAQLTAEAVRLKLENAALRDQLLAARK
jgi:uncharacterized coiled-coil DUF342 family protein